LFHIIFIIFFFIFFLSSRSRHTRFSRDWSSHVCSSDLTANKEIQLYENQQQKTQRLKELLLNYYSTSGIDFQEVIRTQQEEVTYETERVKAEVRLLKAAKEWEYVNLD